MYFLKELILILVFSLILGQLFARYNFPAVIGQLLSGIILGPAILNWISPTSTISLFSEFGIIILMFLAGLNSDLSLLKEYFSLSFTIASIGIIFAATSVSISVAVLHETKQLHTRAGSAIMGAAVVDDVLAILVLSLFTTLSHEGQKNSLNTNWFLNILLDIGYFVLIWIIYKFIIPTFQKITKK